MLCKKRIVKRKRTFNYIKNILVKPNTKINFEEKKKSFWKPP